LENKDCHSFLENKVTTEEAVEIGAENSSDGIVYVPGSNFS
jgi:hypothetical protein